MARFFHLSFLACLAYFLLINAYHFLVLAFSWWEARYRKRQREGEHLEGVLFSDFTIPVSVIVTAYNEEVQVADAVLAVLKNGYPNFEVVVVNDGSTDRTLEVLKREFALERITHFYRAQIPTKPVRAIFRSRVHPNLLVADKRNGGTHADAGNVGVNLARYRYVLFVDADTILEPGAILKSIRLALRNPREVVGVGSTIGVANGLDVREGRIRKYRAGRRILPNLQVLEYLRVFLVNRLGWSRGNFNLCLAGAFCLWRRDVLVEMGGLQKDFSCDDLEMTFRVHDHFRRNKIPYRILSLPDPVCWTEVPSKTYSLYQQRHRWQRVTNETAWRYLKMLFNPRYGSMGFLGAPYLWFAEVIGPWIELFSYLLIPVGWALGELSFAQLGLFLMCSAGLTSLLSLASLYVFDTHYPVYKMGDIFRLCVTSAAEYLGFRQTLSVARFMGSLATFFGVKSWNRVEREASFASAPRGSS